MGLDHVSPLSLFKLLAHDLRWQIVTALARSDCRVQDLVRRFGEPQNLVSYHLAQLRALKLVTERRSDADGRDVYYHLDLDRLRDLYRAAGTALHPALVGETDLAPPSLPQRPRVLFLCTHNSARSQMAEGIMRAYSHGSMDIFSAGSEPTQIHPAALRVMAKIGIDISQQRAKHMDEFAGHSFDYVVTVCDRIRESCPSFSGNTTYAHWSILDPVGADVPDGMEEQVFRQTLMQLSTMIRYFLILLEREQKQRGGS
jgi:ArsR family transcriptional regulator, arsenate/arsenite/antimonite-responsive transcriptional repressor / arsenate reductase (thioredoxin)